MRKMRQGIGGVWRGVGLLLIGATLLLSGIPFTSLARAESQQGKLTADDAGSLDSFGFSVAASGNTTLIGAYGKNTQTGEAYVYTRGGTTWSQQQKLTASDPAANDYFGFSIAVSGDTAIVGAVGKNNNAGAAYIFTRSGTTWSQQQKLTASNAAANDYFGSSVALSGDTAIVGADGVNGSTGVAYVFTRSGGAWTPQQQLASSDATANDYFGFSVALSGDTAIVGAGGKDNSAGAAYIFTRTNGAWAQQQRLTASDPAQNSDFFGVSVAASGDSVLVGAYGKNNSTGAAYVFTRANGTWTQQQQLTASGAAPFGSVGFSVALSGDTAIVGAGGKDNSAGAAYIFTRTNGAWAQQQQVAPSDPTGDEAFGRAVAVSNDIAVVGAYGKNSGTGAAYAFTRANGTWS